MRFDPVDLVYFLGDNFVEKLHWLYLKYRKFIPIILLVLYFVFSGVERYHFLRRIAELQYRKDQRDFPVYVDGVKRGLTFKKHQRGRVP